MRRLLICAFLLAALATPVLADFRVVTQTTTGGENANEAMHLTVESFVREEEGNFFIRESSNPLLKVGTYLYTPDGAATLFHVDPENRTVSEWNMEAFIEFGLSVLKSLGPLVKFQIVDPEVKLISENPGPKRGDLDTMDYVFASQYGLEARIFGIKQRQHIQETTKIRTATLPITLGVFMRTDPPRTGTEFDKLVENSPWAKLKEDQVALEYRVDSVVTSGKKNKKQVSWQETRALELELESSGPEGGYGYPSDYQKVEAPQFGQLATADQAPEDEKQEKKGLRGLLRRKKDGG